MVPWAEIYVGAIVTVNLGLSIRNARELGTDPVARKLGRSAHGRIDTYLQDDHDALETDGGEHGP